MRSSAILVKHRPKRPRPRRSVVSVMRSSAILVKLETARADIPKSVCFSYEVFGYTGETNKPPSVEDSHQGFSYEVFGYTGETGNVRRDATLTAGFSYEVFGYTGETQLTAPGSKTA